MYKMNYFSQETYIRALLQVFSIFWNYPSSINKLSILSGYYSAWVILYWEGIWESDCS